MSPVVQLTANCPTPTKINETHIQRFIPFVVRTQTAQTQRVKPSEASAKKRIEHCAGPLPTSVNRLIFSSESLDTETFMPSKLDACPACLVERYPRRQPGSHRQEVLRAKPRHLAEIAHGGFPGIGLPGRGGGETHRSVHGEIGSERRGVIRRVEPRQEVLQAENCE